MNTLSIEELIKYAEEKVANLTKVIDQSAFTSIKERLIEELQLAQVGLDALRSSLKGDQVPEVSLAEYCKQAYEIVETWPQWKKNGADVTKFTAPQKPVVLPEIISALYRTSFHEGYRTIEVYRVNDVKAAIEAAGVVVKDGE